MANETTLMYETHMPIPFTVNDNEAIEKGALCILKDLMSVSGHSSGNQPVAGIAKTEKISGDGNTKIAVYRRGIFKGIASGAISEGDPLYLAGTANKLASLSGVKFDTFNVAGTSFETVADGESFAFELDPKVMHFSGTGGSGVNTGRGI